MVSDLVAGTQNLGHGLREALCAVAGHEEGGLHIPIGQDPQQPRHTGRRAIPLVRHQRRPAGEVGVGGEHDGLGIEVERHGDGGPAPLGPRVLGLGSASHRHHPETNFWLFTLSLSNVRRMPWRVPSV